MIFNTHTHLNSDQLYHNFKHFLEKANNEGVTKFMVVGYDLESSKKAIEIANSHPGVYASIGIHPSEVEKMEEKDLEEIEALLKEEKVKAIGEIGLDYYWDKNEEFVKLQKKYFQIQIDLANKYKLPIIIHCRDALQDTYEILKENKTKLHKGIMHCYSGSVEMMQDFIDLGLFISLGGPVTFKNAKTPKQVAKEIDINKLLVETDDPYLCPHPFRGQLNEPKNVIYVVKEIANLKEISEEEIADKTYKNALEVFNICE